MEEEATRSVTPQHLFWGDVSLLFRCRAPSLFLSVGTEARTAPNGASTGLLDAPQPLLFALLNDDQMRVGDVQRRPVLGELHFQHILVSN